MDRLAKRRRDLSQVEPSDSHWRVGLEVERTYPFRKPDWRSRLAQEFSSGEKELPAECHDKWLHLAWRYYRLAASPTTAAKCAEAEFKSIRRAKKLHKSTGYRRQLVRRLLKNNFPLVDIAEHTRLHPETIEAYAALFFEPRQKTSTPTTRSNFYYSICCE